MVKPCKYYTTDSNYVPKPYQFEYGVSDPHTGDHKHQWEAKDEQGVVRGSYSLLEPDGTTRIVDYIADKAGFRAVVKRVTVHGHVSVENHGGHIEHSPLITTPIVVAEPVIYHQQPLEVVQHQPVLQEQPHIIEEPLSFGSYDGGVEDYQGLVPHAVRLEGIPEAPKHEIVLSQPEIVHQGIGALRGEHQVTYSIPQEVSLPQHVPQHQDLGSYQIAYAQPEIQHYQEAAPDVRVEYKGPQVLHSIPLVEAYRAPQEIRQSPSIPTYSVPQGSIHSEGPVESYSYEQSFGGPAIWAQSSGEPGHVVHHPHGQSGQHYFGTTGNIDDH
ncbi:unnamed protein product [Acanthoscelides obtectus]|uniref:Uncharacterized protein n=1 Tax=Acanthoscelides obtectus TaxID=200917 RepID=A0A9P0Q4Q8_ACAOB|nr:unnamed protein product [Acanthoscelides obtectus]CAK1670374.1 hypothetical protein AOBTE_LOCUS27591 [Acanthoscelides obtectus]